MLGSEAQAASRDLQPQTSIMQDPSLAEIRRKKVASSSLRLKRSLASALLWGVTIAIMAMTLVYAYHRLNPPVDPVVFSKATVSPAEVLPDVPKRKPPSKVKPERVVVPPNSTEDARVTRRSQREMFDKMRAATDRCESMGRSGALSEEDMTALSKMMEQSSAIYVQWEVAYKAERWPNVVRLIRKMNANSAVRQKYLDAVEQRKREAPPTVIVALNEVDQDRKREAARKLKPVVPKPDTIAEAKKRDAAAAAAALKREAEALEAKKRVELQELLEKTALYCSARDSKRLLEVLTKLDKLLPDDPVIHFTLAEVYSSTGSFKRAKALSAFRKFLDLSTDERLRADAKKIIEADVDEEVLNIKRSLVASLCMFGNVRPRMDLQEVRMNVHANLDSLNDGYRLLLMTPLQWIETWKSNAERELDHAHRTIDAARDEIVWCRASPARAKKFRRRSKSETIQFYKQVIAREKKKAKLLNEELGLLQEGRRKGKKK